MGDTIGSVCQKIKDQLLSFKFEYIHVRTDY